MGYVYGIYLGKDLVYVGSTIRDVQKRFQEHNTKIRNDKHDYIKKNELSIDGNYLHYETLAEVKEDSLLEFVEVCYISLFRPRNKAIIRKVEFKPLSQDTAKIMLDAMEDSNKIESYI